MPTTTLGDERTAQPGPGCSAGIELGHHTVINWHARPLAVVTINHAPRSICQAAQWRAVLNRCHNQH